VTAERVANAALARDLLLRQLTSPVRWVQVIEAMAREHPGAMFVEMGPGSVLTGLLKRLAPGYPAMACGTVAEVEQLLAKLG
jgi:[acyl-carrier-protein] S-malonyltransferase